jgi:hypothetical protein
MKNLFYTSLSLFFGVLLIIVSCKKDAPGEAVPCTSCQKINEAKDYFAFKVGSWWVYEEETSLERDSVYVTESYIDEDGYDFNVRIYSTLENAYTHYWPTFVSQLDGCSANSLVTKKCLFVNKSKYELGNYMFESQCFFVAYFVGAFESTGGSLDNCQNNKITVQEIFSNFNVMNNTFAKTIKIHEDCSLAEGCQPTNFYYSKDVGIVKKELIDSTEVWNLVNYHIEP